MPNGLLRSIFFEKKQRMAGVADQCTKPAVLEMLGFGTHRYERFTDHPVKVLPISFCHDVHKSENAQTCATPMQF